MRMNLNGLAPGKLKGIISIYDQNGSVCTEYGEVTKMNGIVWKPFQTSKLFSEVEKMIRQDVKESVFYIPKNVLAFSQKAKKIIFYTVPERRLVFFSFRKKGLNMFLPGLVFKVDNKTMSVYAFKKRGRPDMNTRLYHSPLPNGSTRFCFGNVKFNPDYSDPQKLIDYVISIYFNSSFTEESTYQMLGDKNVKRHYENLARRKKFPNDVLMKTNKKLRGIM